MISRPSARERNTGAARAMLCAGLLACGAARTFADEPARDVVLFVGLDVIVNHPEKSGRVEDYQRGSMLVDTAEGLVPVRTAEVKSIQMVHEPKVTATQIEIDGVKTERTIGVMNDPGMQALQQHAALLDYQSVLQDSAMAAEQELTAAHNRSYATEEDRQRAIRSAVDRSDAAQRQLTQNSGDPTLLLNRSLDGADEAYDTFAVTCTLASPVELNGAYALFVILVRKPDSPAVATHYRMDELPAIGSRPRKIRLSQTGLPPGFTVVSYAIHIYCDGRELASNLSPNRTMVSRTDAHSFLMLRRELKHRDDDVPAEVATGLLAPGDSGAISPAHRHRTAKIGIDAEGKVTSVALDTAGTPETDGPIEATIRSMLFLPTLKEGRPVASTLTFNLSELIP